MNLDPSAENNNGANRDFQKKSSKKKTLLRILSILFALVFVFVSYVMFKMYRQMRDMKEVFAAMEEMSNNVVPVGGVEGVLPEVPQSGMSFNSSNRPIESSLFKSGGENSDDTFKLMKSGAFIQKAKRMDSDKVMKAISKYSDRPIVKEIMSDLNKNPDFREAMKYKEANNPTQAMESIGKIKGMNKIILKYALRPEFIKLFLEVMKDPEIKPLIDMSSINAVAQDTVVAPSPAEELETEKEVKELELNFEILRSSRNYTKKAAHSDSPPPLN